jgi:hypothetical protein
VLDRYPIDADIVRDARGKLRMYHVRLPTAAGRQLTKWIHARVPTTYRIDGHRFRVFGEKQWFEYDPRFATLSGSTYLNGYWQSRRYGEGAAEVIRSELRLIRPPSAANQAWLARIQSAATAVALHVRRGDYLNVGTESTLVCARSYYDKALRHMRERLGDPQVFVFSDDIPWCRDAFSALDVAFVDVNGPDDATEDLRLMAACRHHIIANSSLSWWGAWLARHPEQVVIAPQPWWNDPAPSLLLADWITLPRL